MPSLKNNLHGQIAVVTGGVRGIGLGIAQRLAQEGCEVVIWDRDVQAFDEAQAGFKPALIQAVDVSEAGQVEQAMADVIRAKNTSTFLSTTRASMGR